MGARGRKRDAGYQRSGGNRGLRTVREGHVVLVLVLMLVAVITLSIFVFFFMLSTGGRVVRNLCGSTRCVWHRIPSFRPTKDVFERDFIFSTPIRALQDSRLILLGFFSLLL